MNFTRLPADIQLRIDQLCDQFEAAWEAGTPLAIEAQLQAVEPANRSALLCELVHVEQWHRRQAGEQPALEEYLARFPEYVDELRRLAGGDGATDRRRESRSAAGARSLWPTTTHDSGAPETTTPPEAPSAGSDSESPDPLLGRMIGPYRVIELLGRGGMGHVYRVEHTLIRCERALKTIRPQLAANTAALRRFLIEAQAGIRDLGHPNIVTLYDVGRDGDTVYLVMELLQGVDLFRLVQRRGPLPFEEAAEILQQAARGLEFAHTKGFIHRDIKPNNIMFTVHGEVKILDLGLVRALDDETDETGSDPTEPSAADRFPADYERILSRFTSRITHEQDLLGTLPYMSPEQARDPRAAGPASDIYSLGCTFYFLLTGRHAFGGRSPKEVLARHLQSDFVAPRTWRPDLPEELESILSKMMQAEAARRYASAAGLRQALEEWQRGGSQRVSVRNLDELRRGLLSLQVVSEDDWNTAIRSSSRAAPEWRGETVAVPADSTENLHPAIVLNHLQSLQSGRGGQKYGLSEYQVRTILNENADLLRLPNHVILDQVGSGWKGEVFKARNLSTNRVEALRTFSPKLLLGLHGDDHQRLKLFEGHAARLQSLRHPALVPVRNWGRYRNRIHGELAYLATEFVEGRSLARSVHESRARVESPLTVGWALQQMAILARALQEVHEADLLHLDLSADCLLVDRDQRLLLTDTGVSLLVREHGQDLWRTSAPAAAPPRARSSRTASASETRAGTMAIPTLGTPVVTPPEMLRDPRAASPAADLYGLGCCLFYLFAGEYPFPGASAVQLMNDHLTSSPRKSVRASAAPGPVWELLDRLLAKRPSDRPSSAAEVAAALEALAASRKVPAQATLGWHEQPQPKPTSKLFGFLRRRRP